MKKKKDTTNTKIEVFIKKHSYIIFGLLAIGCAFIIYNNLNKKKLVNIFLLGLSGIVFMLFCFFAFRMFKKKGDPTIPAYFLSFLNMCFLTTFSRNMSLLAFVFLILPILPAFVNKLTKQGLDNQKNSNLWWVAILGTLMSLSFCFLPIKISLIVLWILSLILIFVLLLNYQFKQSEKNSNILKENINIENYTQVPQNLN